MGLALQNDLFGNAVKPQQTESAPPEASVKYATYRELGKPVYRNSFGKVYMDPRPDIDDDAELWVTLLALADKLEPKLWEALLGFRCIGARLLPVAHSGAYVLRPHLDASGDSGFRSQEEYKAEAERWLRPHSGQFKQLLAELRKLKSKMWDAWETE
ncbi:hypothetical protein HSX37_16295|uniref:Uncharacterized protein n=1 Tax=Dendrosporobacter quercicolus TaxID=146817 RepID=A0A1G9ZT19_9FIRM|nr:hypothetical protein [Dendrosporobacter quercicolus]NSL49597.1 hypothetical protein [Dendrosporobacter quercicolus DSM 1736]SDN24265.1 hypothetical protein SAMN04488502_11553 [Dendrosporobacter quercicolus]